MSTLSYLHAKSLLSEVEKDRIVCTYLNSTEPNAIDWAKAAAEYGSASVDSYKKGVQNTTKKIKKAMESGDEPEAAAGEASPAKKSGGGKKRKGKAAEGDGDAEGGETPAKKKKGRKAKAAKAAAAAEESDDGDVKAEEDD